MRTNNGHWTYLKNWTIFVEMEIATKARFAEIYSKSAPERNIEVEFMRRLAMCASAMKVSDLSDVVRLHALVNSGEFNELFPAWTDEGPVAPKSFQDLKVFDYQSWSDRHSP